MDDLARVLPLSGIHNFRDYGGYPATGGRLKQGLLWRSGQHCGAQADDLAKVHDLGIVTVIDLRGDSERERYPCLRHDEFSGDVLFAPGETAGMHGRAVHEEFKSEIVTAQDAHAAMTRLYATLPWRPVLVGTMRLYFDALAHRRGPSLLHCLAGKDRTGVAAAIAHHLLGVHPDDAMADYLLTNAAGDSEARIAAGSKNIRGNFGEDIEPDAIRVVMGVHEDFLNAGFGQVVERHGSIDAYAEEVLLITPQMRDRMLAALVE